MKDCVCNSGRKCGSKCCIFFFFIYIVMTIESIQEVFEPTFKSSKIIVDYFGKLAPSHVCDVI